jgi:hypothetical protein
MAEIGHSPGQNRPRAVPFRDTIPEGESAMGRNSLLLLLWSIVVAALFILVRETYLSVVVDEIITHLANRVGVERPRMMAAIAPFVIYGSVAAAAIYGAFRLGVHERSLKPPFEFIFDKTFVKKDSYKDIYSVGLHIKSKKTILFPTVRAHKSPFTDTIIADYHLNMDAAGSTIVYSPPGGAIDPTVTEPIELCALPFRENFPPNKTHVLHGVQRFTLEARCRDAPPYTAEFEYDPDKTPMIRLLRKRPLIGGLLRLLGIAGDGRAG